MNEELKPCPFCLSVAPTLVGQYSYDPHQGFGTAYIFCKKCHANGPHKPGEDFAKIAWNTRAEQSDKE